VSRFLVAWLFAGLTLVSAAQAVPVLVDAWSHGPTKVATVGLYSVFKVGVLAALSFFMWVRNPSRRPSREPLAIGACAVALAAVAALEPPSASGGTGWALAGDAIAAASYVWLFASILTLGRCFGVLPEARGLVTSGPYRLVRHPVYLGELGACAGLVVAAPGARNVAIAVLFFAAQWIRMRLEEETLAEAFPAYRDYAARTPRLLPLVAGRGLAPVRATNRLS
jgi:protein-S-isoprenylcysteine O-methyltransferase Ste14